MILRKFPVLKEKAGKSNFNTLLLKIDKGSKWRAIQPMLFFVRRIITAGLLCLPISNQYIFLQYIFILVTSHIYILYLVASKPYQTPVFNAYMLANETFYSALIILIFIFSDATPQLNIKVIAGGCLVTSIFLLVLANIIFIGYIVIKGKDNLKIAIKEDKRLFNTLIHDINAYVQPNGTDYLMGCGQDATNLYPGIWKIYSNGNNGFYWNINLNSDSSCQGLTHDPILGQSTMLIRSNSETFKAFSKGYPSLSYDIYLVTITDSGTLASAIQISYST